MRFYGLANLTYGTTGLISSLSLNRIDGSLVSLWIMVVGAAAFLGLAAGVKKTAAALLR